MNTATPATRDLARRLIALEAVRAPSDGVAGEAARACEKLRGPLARLAGAAGFRSLLARALTLAKMEASSLQSVEVRADGSLEGFDAVQGGEAVVAQLLGLLVTFIGEPLTRQLVREAWPDASSDETGGRP